MNRIGLAALAVVLGILIAVFYLRSDRDPSGPASSPAESRAPRSVKGVPVASRLPEAAPAAGDFASEKKPLKLTPEQTRAMHRLIQTYQEAQRTVRDFEDSEALGEEQETERFGTDAEGIRAAINSNIEDIQHCYEAWLALNPELQGRIVTHFAIDAPEEGTEGGEVVEVNLRDGGLGNKFLEGCVMSVVSELKFERPDGRIDVNYPFIFKTAPAEDEE